MNTNHQTSSKINAPASDDLQHLPLSEVEKKLNSSPQGLTQSEAISRLQQYGLNEIAEKKTNPLLNLNSAVESSEFTQYTFSQKVFFQSLTHHLGAPQLCKNHFEKKSLRNFICFNCGI